jgi:hypothetical protein
MAELRARRGPTPEVFFDKRLDNTRLVKVDNPQLKRELWHVSTAASFLFLFLLLYLVQHYKCVVLGYQEEAQKQQLAQLQEQQRQLSLAEAVLTRPERMDQLAKQMGLDGPQPGQFVDSTSGMSAPGTPLLAQVATPGNSRPSPN